MLLPPLPSALVTVVLTLACRGSARPHPSASASSASGIFSLPDPFGSTDRFEDGLFRDGDSKDHFSGFLRYQADGFSAPNQRRNRGDSVSLSLNWSRKSFGSPDFKTSRSSSVFASSQTSVQPPRTFWASEQIENSGNGWVKNQAIARLSERPELRSDPQDGNPFIPILGGRVSKIYVLNQADKSGLRGIPGEALNRHPRELGEHLPVISRRKVLARNPLSKRSLSETNREQLSLENETTKAAQNSYLDTNTRSGQRILRRSPMFRKSPKNKKTVTLNYNRKGPRKWKGRNKDQSPEGTESQGSNKNTETQDLRRQSSKNSQTNTKPQNLSLEKSNSRSSQKDEPRNALKSRGGTQNNDLTGNIQNMESRGSRAKINHQHLGRTSSKGSQKKNGSKNLSIEKNDSRGSQNLVLENIGSQGSQGDKRQNNQQSSSKTQNMDPLLNVQNPILSDSMDWSKDSKEFEISARVPQDLKVSGISGKNTQKQQARGGNQSQHTMVNSPIQHTMVNNPIQHTMVNNPIQHTMVNNPIIEPLEQSNVFDQKFTNRPPDEHPPQNSPTIGGALKKIHSTTSLTGQSVDPTGEIQLARQPSKKQERIKEELSKGTRIESEKSKSSSLKSESALTTDYMKKLSQNPGVKENPYAVNAFDMSSTGYAERKKAQLEADKAEKERKGKEDRQQQKDAKDEKRRAKKENRQDSNQRPFSGLFKSGSRTKISDGEPLDKQNTGLGQSSSSSKKNSSKDQSFSTEQQQKQSFSKKQQQRQQSFLKDQQSPTHTKSDLSDQSLTRHGATESFQVQDLKINTSNSFTERNKKNTPQLSGGQKSASLQKPPNGISQTQAGLLSHERQQQQQKQRQKQNQLQPQPQLSLNNAGDVGDVETPGMLKKINHPGASKLDRQQQLLLLAKQNQPPPPPLQHQHQHQHQQYDNQQERAGSVGFGDLRLPAKQDIVSSQSRPQLQVFQESEVQNQHTNPVNIPAAPKQQSQPAANQQPSQLKNNGGTVTTNKKPPEWAVAKIGGEKLKHAPSKVEHPYIPSHGQEAMLKGGIERGKQELRQEAEERKRTFGLKRQTSLQAGPPRPLDQAFPHLESDEKREKRLDTENKRQQQTARQKQQAQKTPHNQQASSSTSAKSSTQAQQQADSNLHNQQVSSTETKQHLAQLQPQYHQQLPPLYYQPLQPQYHHQSQPQIQQQQFHPPSFSQYHQHFIPQNFPPYNYDQNYVPPPYLPAPYGHPQQQPPPPPPPPQQWDNPMQQALQNSMFSQQASFQPQPYPSYQQHQQLLPTQQSQSTGFDHEEYPIYNPTQMQNGGNEQGSSKTQQQHQQHQH